MVARLVPPHPVHNGSKDFIGLSLQAPGLYVL
jgi:hypothetical protein